MRGEIGKKHCFGLKSEVPFINPLKTKRICFIYKDSVRTAL
jgi:hypothetical protein